MVVVISSCNLLNILIGKDEEGGRIWGDNFRMNIRVKAEYRVQLCNWRNAVKILQLQSGG